MYIVKVTLQYTDKDEQKIAVASDEPQKLPAPVAKLAVSRGWAEAYKAPDPESEGDE